MRPLPPFVVELFEAGGLVPWVGRQLGDRPGR
jgi:hypothetical protein